MFKSDTALITTLALVLLICVALALRIDYKVEQRLVAIEQRLAAIEANLDFLDKRVSHLELIVLGSRATTKSDSTTMF